ncbi:probable inactive leucine-rich repeat receptor-like protein kinase At3g03770 isoform X2 [Malania oleifera]|uniref:probable inactive leucine-rich repeat receptor-like protein kinase At3g03770 isoform X2 n=1 Tax=Malania oleifera TaxID=397392 RepID=UPI0025ADFE88|nr:probable inactive leucine-rich repeat receptor-like protein kinase At3g03770 isoform X2 [Malania oleifera]XP_057976327.1 probable inactive leucine-rich repeat receptor-like protein kinase At3g03770 isoform X2 [Malania oleifera]XP_057976328.1 probable inactive leucine-rich repeat receptor-like protein kinase At3g03770 isoform X2 [Malania oleifera]XP_057976329.1 probable inactive leucine-rich repeat receptor-like protein kinase At3g03770 isoform X2 [Malania oleifera]
MGKLFSYSEILFMFIISLSVHYSEQLQSSQALTLLRIQEILNFPAILSGWKNSTDFCNTEPSSSLTVVCYEETITQLHIIGDKGVFPLPQNFSIDSFITTLVKLPNLKVLTLVSLGLWGPFPGKIARLSSLEILNISSNFFYGAIPEEMSSLTSLQTLVLDDNMFTGQLPDWLGSLPVLSVLSLKKNWLDGSLPDSLRSLVTLRILVLSHNHFFGKVPDLSTLTNLQILDLENNSFGPQFPQLGNKLVTLVLRKNRFSSAIPDDTSSYYQLQRLDISLNKFLGPFQLSLLSLPSITYLNIAGNRFTGMLFENLPCNSQLEYVDLSSNLLTGSLPSCLLSDSKDRMVLYSRNCLATHDQNQHPLSFCRKEALAVGILPRRHKRLAEASKAVLALGIIGGIVGGIALVGLAFFVVRRSNAKKPIKSPPTTLITENTSTGYSSKLLSGARYISQATKMGTLGLPGYRNFSLEELEEATNNFDTSTFMGEGSHGKVYRGQLKDGSLVAIRCLKMKKPQGIQNFMHHIELISKFRHCHLVSALGHCFECYLDDSTVKMVFLVFEYVPNGTLRDRISGWHARQTLTWPQRIAAAIGVAKGIQFLHTGIMPGVFSNNLKITDVLLDRNLVAKINSYNLPLLTQNIGKVGQGISSGGYKEYNINASGKIGDKTDVYDFGVILLEIITGRPLSSRSEVDVVKDQLQASITADDATRRTFVDSEVCTACSDLSLKTMMDICMRCLLKDPADRPSVDDVLWNLQFAAQVQDAWRGDSQSSEGSPASPSQPPQLHLTSQKYQL